MEIDIGIAFIIGGGLGLVIGLFIGIILGIKDEDKVAKLSQSEIEAKLDFLNNK